MLKVFITEQAEYYKLKKAPVYLGKTKNYFPTFVGICRRNNS